MKTWTETLAALAVLFTVAACTSGDVGSITPDIDEEAVAKVQADVEGWIFAKSTSVHPSSGLPQPPVEQRGIDPDLDEEEIREYANGNPSPGPWHNPISLNDAEIDLLLERLRAKKAAEKGLAR